MMPAALPETPYTTATEALARPYQSVPGTIPHRVIEHFKDLPPGTELSLATIAEDLDIDLPGLGGLLAWPRSRGALKTRRREGFVHMLWSLGDGVPHAPQDDDDPVPVPLSAWPIRQGLAPDEAAANDTSADAFRCELVASGQLELHLGPTTISLAPSHTRALFRYLDTLAADAA